MRAQAIRDSIDRLLDPWKKEVRPGISIAVVKMGELVYQGQAGMADISRNIANDSTTTFWIASVTKQFTAAAVYKLALQKRLSLDKSVRQYLKNLPRVFDGITIEHLIHHTGGARDGFVLTALAKKPPSFYTNENVLHYLERSEEVNFNAGDLFEYNNSGYVLLAKVIETVSGISYPQYVQENIFLPLQMNNSYVSPAFPVATKQAKGYRQVTPGNFNEYHFEGNTYGSTGMVTTLSDLVKWERFMQFPGSVPALQAIVPFMLKTGKLNGNKPLAYAGGLEKFEYRGNVVYEHFGADEGFKADMLFFPGTQVSVIGLTNNDSYYDLTRLLYRVSDIVHRLPAADFGQVDESADLKGESYYYNSHVPRLVKLQRFDGYVRIGATPRGYAAPFRPSGDTLISFDPVPTRYLKAKDYLLLLSPHASKNDRLQRITLVQAGDQLKDLEGEYFAEEIGTSYKLLASAAGLQFEFVPGVVFDLFQLTEADFVFEYLGPNFVQITKEGFAFSREGCRKLQFKRIR